MLTGVRLNSPFFDSTDRLFDRLVRFAFDAEAAWRLVLCH